MPAATLYNYADPFDNGYLKLGPIHEIYFEQYGNRLGRPVLFLHGGPGGQISRENAGFFNPGVYRVVLFDQRGAGKSRPLAELRANTTWHLVADIEMLRNHVGVKKWHMVFGGSWGSTLALAYSETHPHVVGSLVLRGVLGGTREELEAIHQSISSRNFFPDAHEEWLSFLSERDRADPVSAYYRILTSNEVPETERLAAGRSWNKRELQMGQVSDSADLLQKLNDRDWVIAHSRLEAHYFSNDLFLRPGQLMEKHNLERIRNIPGQSQTKLCPFEQFYVVLEY